MAGFWATVPTDRVVHLRGASPESIELSLENAPDDSPATVVYYPQTSADLSAAVAALLLELDRVARGLLPQWLPKVMDFEGLGGAGRAATRVQALERAASLGVPGAFLADLAERALAGAGVVRGRFGAEVRAASLVSVITTSYRRDRLAVVIHPAEDLSITDAELLVAAGEWFVNHGHAGVWLVGTPWAAISRIMAVTVQLSHDVEAIVETTEASADQAAPAVVYPAGRGQPRWDSPAERRLEDALSRRPWAHGRAWNETYQPDALTSPIRVDLLWRQERCAVEIDGPEHRALLRFESDRRRDVRLQLDGFAVLRFTNTQVLHDLDTVVSQLEQFITERRRDKLER